MTSLLGDVTSSAVQLPLKSVSQERRVASEQGVAEQIEEMELFELRAFRRGETHDWMPGALFKAVRKVEHPVEMDAGILEETVALGVAAEVALPDDDAAEVALEMELEAAAARPATARVAKKDFMSSEREGERA